MCSLFVDGDTAVTTEEMVVVFTSSSLLESLDPQATSLCTDSSQSELPMETREEEVAVATGGGTSNNGRFAVQLDTPLLTAPAFVV